MRCQQSRSLQLAVKVLYGFVAFLVITVAVLVSLGEPGLAQHHRLNCICKHEVLETQKKGFFWENPPVFFYQLQQMRKEHEIEAASSEDEFDLGRLLLAAPESIFRW